MQDFSSIMDGGTKAYQIRIECQVHVFKLVDQHICCFAYQFDMSEQTFRCAKLRQQLISFSGGVEHAEPLQKKIKRLAYLEVCKPVTDQAAYYLLEVASKHTQGFFIAQMLGHGFFYLCHGQCLDFFLYFSAVLHVAVQVEVVGQ